MFEKIKEAYKKYNSKVIQKEFEEALRNENYVYALKLAESHYKKISLSVRDIDVLSTGFHGYQNRLNRLEAKVNPSTIEDKSRRMRK